MWGKREEPKLATPADASQPAESPRPVVTQPSAALASDADRFTETSHTTSSPAQSTISRITHTLSIHGQISGEDDLYIDGEMSGTIRIAGGKVTVGPNGRVDSDIESREIEIHGQAQGLLRAAERIFLGRTASVSGDIVTRRLAIEDGAFFTGRVELVRPETAGDVKKPETVAARAASASAGASSSPATLAVAGSAGAPATRTDPKE
jgi:cytoskeletal protein CcmA (bactofilin family)